MCVVARCTGHSRRSLLRCLLLVCHRRGLCALHGGRGLSMGTRSVVAHLPGTHHRRPGAPLPSPGVGRRACRVDCMHFPASCLPSPVLPVVLAASCPPSPAAGRACSLLSAQPSCRPCLQPTVADSAFFTPLSISLMLTLAAALKNLPETNRLSSALAGPHTSQPSLTIL